MAITERERNFLGAVLSLCVALLGAYFSLNQSHENKGLSRADWEPTVFKAWSEQIKQPEKSFSKIVLGVNSNVDLIVGGTALLRRLNLPPSGGHGVDHAVLRTAAQLEEAFSFSFSRGAGVERAFSDPEGYAAIVDAASQLDDADWYIGGNAALMAQEIVEEFPDKEVWLVGPVGPRLAPLLAPRMRVPDDCLQATDEVHLIMEFKVGEMWGQHEARVATRFITSFDEANSRLRYLSSFLDTVSDSSANLAVLSGLNQLETQPETEWNRVLQELTDGLPLLPPTLTLHLELASMANERFVSGVVAKILPLVSSVGLNEQELAFLSTVAGGPFSGRSSATPRVHTVADILAWMLRTYGRSSGNNPRSRLTRVHFHSLAYHVIATLRGTWHNSQSAVMAGTRTASLQACNTTEFSAEKFALQIPDLIPLVGEAGNLGFDPAHPGSTWSEGDVEFHFSPVMVCKKPLRTVGLGDAISATGLLYSYCDGSSVVS